MATIDIKFMELKPNTGIRILPIRESEYIRMHRVYNTKAITANMMLPMHLMDDTRRCYCPHCEAEKIKSRFEILDL